MRYDKLLPFLGIIFGIATSAASPSPTGSHSFDLQRSRMTVYVFKHGLFAFAADNHEIDAPILSGALDEAKNTIDLAVDASKLKVLDPKLGADRRARVQANMTGPGVLDVEHYPRISFHSKESVFDGSGHGTIHGDLSLHGQTHQITFNATRAGAKHFSGSALVRQSDFGITPIRIAGGAVSVKDDVKVVFDIYLRE